MELDRFERVYRRREKQFLSLQAQQDVSTERVFILSEDKPWKVFGDCSSTKFRRRKMVLERCGIFPTLHESCMTGDYKKVKELLGMKGSCSLTRDSCGRIALHHAVISEQFKIAKRLLRRRDGQLQVHCRDNSRRTALHYVLEKMEILSKHKTLNTVEMKTTSKRYRHLWNVADKMLEMVNREELRRSNDLQESIREIEMRCRGDLWDVCRSGDLERLETIVKVYGLSSEDYELGELKWTLLHEACENQQVQIVHYLISVMKVPVLGQDLAGCTALHCAARRGCLEACQLLLNKIPGCCEDSAVNGEVVEELALCQDERGKTALHWSLIGSADCETRRAVASFLAQSCTPSLHLYDKDGVCPLHLAIWRGDLELVQEFICLGANVCASPLSGDNVGAEREKASWAPCGLVFQRCDKLPSTGCTNELPSSTNCLLSPKRAAEWENMQHPVEGLWYWAQHATTRQTRAALRTTTGCSDATEDELGCHKYGGTCERCRAVKTSAITATTTWCRCLSPMMVALRMCVARGRHGAMVSNRVNIIELLLMSGVDTEGESHNDSGAREQERDCGLSVLAEGFRASLRCPQVFPMLLLHGFNRISLKEIVQCCSTGLEPTETVLSRVVDADILEDKKELLTFLFQRKYFRALRKLIQVWQGVNDDSSSPWEVIQETLASQRNQRKKVGEVRRIDIEHLKFLSDEVTGGIQLLGYCFDRYLEQHASYYLLNGSRITRNDDEESERVALSCIHLLLANRSTEDPNRLEIESKPKSWLPHVLMMGFFDCALVLIEKQQSSKDLMILDTVLEQYAAAIAVRVYRDDARFRRHQTFISICVQTLLEGGPCGVQQLGSPLSGNANSARSVLHVCAYNLSFDLVKRCVDQAGISPNEKRQLESLGTMRLGGRKLVHWLVLHARIDVLELLLMRAAPGPERAKFWGDCVAASSICSSSTDTSFLDALVKFFTDKVKKEISAAECRELLLGLIVKNAIPNDDVSLMKHLLECWGVQVDRTDDTNGEEEAIELVLNKAFVLHTIARWNAVQIARYCSTCYTQNSNLCRVVTARIHDRHEEDECTPLELCRLLGHHHLYSLLKSLISTPEAGEFLSPSTTDLSDPAQQVGLLRTVLQINDNKKRSYNTNAVALRKQHSSFQHQWEAAVALNQVSHLQAMALTTSRGTNLHQLILTAIKHGSIDALKWILEVNSPVEKFLSEAEGVECLYAAARHSGNVYAEMTILLLQQNLSPGRLSGDGMGIPLLHRAACFSDASLACRVMTTLLNRPDCDVNALDAFGNTAVTYAIAAGRLENVCYLIQRSSCRLEAEYEGQSCFYYALHILPSFSWRSLIRELLVTKRSRAFLHCDADGKTCGCKCFEKPRGDEIDDEVCGFCSHEFTNHRVVPLPSWFRDQYDTYIIQTPQRKPSQSSDDRDDEADRTYDEVEEEDEELALENTRGRLDVELLTRVTTIRYGALTQTHRFMLPVVNPREDPAVDDPDEEGEPSSARGHGDTAANDVNNDEVTVEGPTEQSQVMAIAEDDRITFRRDTKCTWKLADCPWSLREALAMVHSPQCTCQSPTLVAGETQLVYIAVCRWLRHAAKSSMAHHRAATDQSVTPPSVIEVIASVEPFFQLWCELTNTQERPNSKLVPPVTLKRAVCQWRYAKEFLAFQRWKNAQSSVEVTHHRLTTRLEKLTAEMRHNRFLTLQLRQQQLQEATRNLI